MFKLVFAILATFTFTEPTIQFTSDSVYTELDIVNIECIKHEDSEITGLVDLQFTFGNLVGYKVYDNSETDYIDGIKINDTWLDSSLVYTDFDFGKENTITIKTVYTDDYAGMVMAAKDGDLSVLLNNPETVFKVIYYVLAALALIVSTLSALFNKKKQLKSNTELCNGIINTTNTQVNEAINKVVTPIIEEVKDNMSKVITSVVLSKSKKSEDILASLELLKNATSSANLKEITAQVVEEVKEEASKKLEVVESAKKDIENIVNNSKGLL